MEEEIKKYAFRADNTATKITSSKLGENVGLIGAASLVFRKFLRHQKNLLGGKALKKGICFEYRKGLSLREQFKWYKKAGFDGIELTFDRGYLTPDTKLSEIEKLKEAVDRIGLEIPSIRGGPNLCWKFPITHPDKKVRENTIEKFKKGLKITSILKGKALLMVPGIVTPEVNYEEAYNRAKDAILRIIEIAEKDKVFLAIENVKNRFLTSPLEMREFIDGIGSSYVSCYLDVGNVLSCQLGYPEQWVRILRKRIKRIHLKDYRSGYGITYLLQGEVNWPSLMEALKEINYDDYLIAELPLYKFYPERMLFETAQNIERIIQGGK